MLTQQTIDSLRALRLPAMSQAYAEQTVPTLEHFDGEEGSCQRSTREAEQRVILTNPAPRALPEPASGNTLYVPLLEVIHWKCPSSLRSDNRVQSIGTNGPNTSGYLPNDFVAVAAHCWNRRPNASEYAGGILQHGQHVCSSGQRDDDLCGRCNC